MERRKELKIKVRYVFIQNARIPERKKKMGKINGGNEGKMENENEEGIYKEKDRENEERQKKARKKCNERTDRDEERLEKIREMKNKTTKQRKTILVSLR
jgi:hypothetical protein